MLCAELRLKSRQIKGGKELKKFNVGDVLITQVVEWEGTFPSPDSLLNG